MLPWELPPFFDADEAAEMGTTIHPLVQSRGANGSFAGKHRLQAAVSHLNNEINILQFNFYQSMIHLCTGCGGILNHTVPFAIRHLLIWNSSCSGHSPSLALHAGTFLSYFDILSLKADDLIHLFSSTAEAQAEAGEEYAHLQRIHHQEQEKRPYYECLVVYDAQNMNKRFHPKRLNCSNYMWVHRNYGGYKMVEKESHLLNFQNLIMSFTAVKNEVIVYRIVLNNHFLDGNSYSILW
ncbi:guanine nucleotide-binding protein subunit gamma 1-like [Senna tora]|uniref:Guanine nucleotide-binding protein subunit gamma 1-like n=1 Tax=Senna tora TaxID=362788 RepID=A0A834XH31_9FABA|nr:guanine nucleotide-binding protein subunit gamma 1-like [Senna tora]